MIFTQKSNYSNLNTEALIVNLWGYSKDAISTKEQERILKASKYFSIFFSFISVSQIYFNIKWFTKDQNIPVKIGQCLGHSLKNQDFWYFILLSSEPPNGLLGEIRDLRDVWDAIQLWKIQQYLSNWKHKQALLVLLLEKHLVRLYENRHNSRNCYKSTME